MAQLIIGKNIQLQSGGILTVLEKLGEGGQGYVLDNPEDMHPSNQVKTEDFSLQKKT